ncbi:MAG: acyl carrier protein, partial [Mycobacterium sp.]
MTVAEVRQWLRNWIGNAVGQSPDGIDEATPMVELGLSSRDAVAMAADIEDRTGVTVSIAAAFEHPTIESLATWIVEGDPFEDDAAVDDTDWTRSGPVERVDIAVVGLATRLP